MRTCPYCGADQFSTKYPHAYHCGSLKGGHRTSVCQAREPLWKELQSAKARIERLISAGDVLCEIQTGPSGRAAIERWNQAKEVKP